MQRSLGALQAGAQVEQARMIRRQLARMRQRLPSTNAIATAQLLLGAVQPGAGQLVVESPLRGIPLRQLGQVGQHVVGLRQLASGERLPELLFHLARQALHAHRLRFVHPRKREVIEATAPLPPDFVTTLAALRKWRGGR